MAITQERVTAPSMDQWLREAKADPQALKAGMYLFHNGVVRETPKELVRNGQDNGKSVRSMVFSYDPERVDQAVAAARALPGIFHIRVWLNQGLLKPGDDIMLVLVGGDIRPRVVGALEYLVERIKTQCVEEIEAYDGD